MGPEEVWPGWPTEAFPEHSLTGTSLKDNSLSEILVSLMSGLCSDLLGQKGPNAWQPPEIIYYFPFRLCPGILFGCLIPTYCLC